MYGKLHVKYKELLVVDVIPTQRLKLFRLFISTVATVFHARNEDGYEDDKWIWDA